MFHLKKHDTTLLIALALPLLMILFIAGSIFIPGLFSHPSYNFVYGIYENTGLQPAYVVTNGKLVDHSSQINSGEIQTPSAYCLGKNCTTLQNTIPQTQYASTQLYEYNVTTKKSSALTAFQAQQFKLNSNAQSPDGYSIQSGNGDNGDLFFGGSYDSSFDQYLVGHNVSTKINYTTNTSIPNANFYLVGWIIH